MATINGSASAIGPWVRPPRAIDAQAIAGHQPASRDASGGGRGREEAAGGSAALCRSLPLSAAMKSATIAAVTNNVSAESKMAVLAKASVNGEAPVAMAAIHPASPPNNLRPNHQTRTSVAMVKRRGLSRAARAVGPSAF